MPTQRKRTTYSLCSRVFAVACLECAFYLPFRWLSPRVLPERKCFLFCIWHRLNETRCILYFLWRLLGPLKWARVCNLRVSSNFFPVLHLPFSPSLGSFFSFITFGWSKVRCCCCGSGECRDCIRFLHLITLFSNNGYENSSVRFKGRRSWSYYSWVGRGLDRVNKRPCPRPCTCFLTLFLNRVIFLWLFDFVVGVSDLCVGSRGVQMLRDSSVEGTVILLYRAILSCGHSRSVQDLQTSPWFLSSTRVRRRHLQQRKSRQWCW